MTRTNKYVLALDRTGRESEEHEGEYLEQDALLWRDLARVWRTAEYQNRDLSASVVADWSPLVRRTVRLADKAPVVQGRTIRIPVSVSCTAKNALDDIPDVGMDIAERYVYDTFLVANISLPGSFGFGGTISDTQSGSGRDDLSLSAYDFDFIWQRIRDEQATALRILEARKTVQWYRHLSAGMSQVAATSVERALFSLLHIARSDASPVSAVWIWAAIESLYEGRKGVGGKDIAKRVEDYLRLPDEESRRFKAAMKSLFDLRSAVAHGQFKVLHPQLNERVEPAVDAELNRLFDVYWIGIEIILSTLQRMVEQGVSKLEFP